MTVPYRASTFSLAHELGHIVLHSKINQYRFDNLAEAKKLEDQANRFASAFLLPAKPFMEDVAAPTIKYFEYLKRKWRGASIATMIRRCYDLGRIDRAKYHSLYVRLSQLRWRKREPLDGFFEIEKPVLLKQIFEALAQKKGVYGYQIARNLTLNATELAAIFKFTRRLLFR